MQNAFMLPGVAFVEIKTAPAIVPNINRLACALRASGGTVVWIVTTYTDEVSVDWSTSRGPTSSMPTCGSVASTH